MPTPLDTLRAVVPHGAGWGSVLAVVALRSPWILTVGAGITVSTWAWVLQQIGSGLLARVVRLERRVHDLERVQCPYLTADGSLPCRPAAPKPQGSGHGIEL